MSNTDFTFNGDVAANFRDTLCEIVTYLHSTFGITLKPLSIGVLGMNDSTLRSLITTVRKTGLKHRTFRRCYILYMLKEGNSAENYLLFFKEECAKEIITEINITDYQKKLESLSPVNKTSSFIAKDNTPTPEIISDTSDETNVSDINKGCESIINNFIEFLNSLPIKYYELNIQNQKFGEYFIINYVYGTKKKPETIVAIALDQEINNTDKSNISSIRKKELEIIEENLDTADIFWFFHHKETTQKQFDNYIQAVPGLIYKTLIEAINDYGEIRIIYKGPKTKLGKVLTNTENIKKCNYKVDWLSTFTIPTSE